MKPYVLQILWLSSICVAAGHFSATAQQLPEGFRVVGMVKPDVDCEVFQPGTYRRLCDCSQVASATERLDCFDNMARVEQLLRRQAEIKARELAASTHGAEAMRSVLQESAPAE